jgi:hypothetical protein
MTLYKVLNEDGSARMGNGSWHLPRGSRPGKWMPPIDGPLVACRNGYHLCRHGDLIQWCGPAIYIAEHKGELLEASDKVVVRRARLVSRLGVWGETTARLFAADCAERVVGLISKHGGNDEAAKRAIGVARRYAHGKASPQELDAARAAAWAAARAAAWDAARDAAWDAERDAARDAAWDAAWAAAWDAAWDAARDAAWDAARDAAWAAAWDAAWDAEREWQTDRLFDYLEGRAP